MTVWGLVKKFQVAIYQFVCSRENRQLIRSFEALIDSQMQEFPTFL